MKRQNPLLITRYSLLIVLLLAATFYRLYLLPHLPPGLNFDEAGSGMAAVDILTGRPRLWWTLGGGQEPLWPYLMALSTLLLGYIPLTVRLPAAFIGILTIAAVYPLTLRLFRQRQAHILALLTVISLTFSPWHLHFSRLGFRAILLPLFSTLAFYFFWKAVEELGSGRVWGYGGRGAGGQGSRGAEEQRSRGAGGQGSQKEENTTHYALRPTPYVSPFTFYVLRFTLSSLFLALSIYSYLAARLLPLVVVLFLLLTALRDGLSLARRGQLRPLAWLRPYLSLGLGLFLPLLLFLLPLILYFSFNPADLVARSATVSIFNPAWHKGDLAGAFLQALGLTLATFLGWTGDPNPLVNLPGQPALSPLLALFFITGCGVCLKQIITSPKQSISEAEASHTPPYPHTPPPNPYLFLLCWWVVMLLPALLAPEGAPHHLRLLGALIPTTLLLSLGLLTLFNALLQLTFYLFQPPTTHHAPRTKFHASRITFHVSRFTLYVLLFTLYALLLASYTYHHYFTLWPASTDFTLPFDLYAVRLAHEIVQAPPEVAYVLPMDIRAGAEARHYTLDYLTAPYRTRAYTYIPVDERNAETLLTQAGAGKRELRVIRWTADKHLEADAKEIVTYLLETSAQPAGRESFPVYDVETYHLYESKSSSPGMNFVLPAIDRPLKVNFDGLLSLEAAYLPATAKPGTWLPVALTLAPLAPMEVDYKASLRLIDPEGQRLAQKDRTLRHNFHQGTSLWPPETVNEYYLLPVPPETPPGEYQVVVVLYHPDTLAPLVADGVIEAPLGPVRIE